MTDAFLEIHLSLIILLFFLPMHNLYVLYTKDNFITRAKRIRFFAPMHHALLAGVILSGVVIAFYEHDFFSGRQFFMYLLVAYLIISEVRRYKKIRVIASRDVELQEEFARWAKRKYSLDIVLLLVSIIVFL